MRKWTEEELQIIRSNRNKPLYTWRDLLPDRSDRAIGSMAKQIGVVITQKKQANEAVARFWKYTERRDSSQCWNWTGSRNRGGYGQIRINGAQSLAHRFSWELHNGAMPNDDIDDPLYVFHTCNNRACVNPAHLFLGTQSDHAKKMVEKRSRHGRSKLTSNQVSEIKHLLREGKLSGREIAEQYQVNRNTIWFIKHGKSWAHVE